MQFFFVSQNLFVMVRYATLKQNYKLTELNGKRLASIDI